MILRLCFLVLLTFINFLSFGQDKFNAIRLNDGQPIITPKMFTNLGVEKEGSNINGPSVIRVPDWISPEDRAHPDAQYYCYFAHHVGDYIRMAWATEPQGPWNLYQVGSSVLPGKRGVLDLGDNVISLDNGIVIPNNHLASPDAHIDHENLRIILYFHSGSPTLVDGKKIGGQFTYVSYSSTGLDFYDNIQPVILGDSYFRVFNYKNNMYAFSNSGNLYKARDFAHPWTPPTGFDFTKHLWEKLPLNIFKLKIAENQEIDSEPVSIRHSTVRLVGDELQVFYTRRGDLLENIQMSSIDLRIGDWIKWDATYPPYQILQTVSGWEGGDLTPAPSKNGPAKKTENQLRDPYIFEDNDGSLYLFYSGGGEDAIGIVKLIEVD